MSDPLANSPAKPGSRPFAPFEWLLALRYLRAKRREGFVSVISAISLVGIALGVAVLIVVMAVMNGFHDELLSKILGLRGHAMIEAVGTALTDYDAVTKKVLQVPGVTRAAPLLEGQVMASASGINSGVLVRGIRQDDLRKFETVSKTLSKDALMRFRGDDAVIIGSRLARDLGIVPGMQITLTSLRGDVTPFGTTPRIKTYTVAGTFNIGMSTYDRLYVFMPLDEAQAFFNYGDSITGIEVMVQDPDRIDDHLAGLQEAAGLQMRVTTWREGDTTYFDAMQVERSVMFLILTLIIAVAALNIVSGLYMLVKDKSADIAILRTMGASRGAILRVFMIAGVSVGTAGTVIGLLLGVLFCANIETVRQFLMYITGANLFPSDVYFLSHMPAKMDFAEVAAVVSMSMGLTFLATLYPAWRAARLDPVEALRYE